MHFGDDMSVLVVGDRYTNEIIRTVLHIIGTISVCIDIETLCKPLQKNLVIPKFLRGFQFGDFIRETHLTFLWIEMS